MTVFWAVIGWVAGWFGTIYGEVRTYLAYGKGRSDEERDAKLAHARGTLDMLDQTQRDKANLGLASAADVVRMWGEESADGRPGKP